MEDEDGVFNVDDFCKKCLLYALLEVRHKYVYIISSYCCVVL